MGIGIGSRSSSGSCYESPTKLQTELRRLYASGNPDPKHFDIQKFEAIGNYLVVKVNYPDCTNYEGNKIIVFRDVTPRQLFSSSTLDPHFFNGTGVQSPIARFVPTDEGWNMAVHFCKHYTGKTY